MLHRILFCVKDVSIEVAVALPAPEELRGKKGNINENNNQKKLEKKGEKKKEKVGDRQSVLMVKVCQAIYELNLALINYDTTAFRKHGPRPG